MASYKRFTGSSGGDIFKFTEPGTTIAGEFVKVFEGKYGPLIVLKVDGAEVTCATSTGLLACFDDAFGGIAHCPVGTNLEIKFVELVQTKKGGTFKRFDLGVDETALPTDTVEY